MDEMWVPVWIDGRGGGGGPDDGVLEGFEEIAVLVVHGGLMGKKKAKTN